MNYSKKLTTFLCNRPQKYSTLNKESIEKFHSDVQPKVLGQVNNLAPGKYWLVYNSYHSNCISDHCLRVIRRATYFSTGMGGDQSITRRSTRLSTPAISLASTLAKHCKFASRKSYETRYLHSLSVK